MLVSGPLPMQHSISRDTPPAWNDPRRNLFPHHAEFWPEEVPEHVRFQRLDRKITRRRRWLFVLRLVYPKTVRKALKRHNDRTGALGAGLKKSSHSRQVCACQPAHSVSC